MAVEEATGLGFTYKELDERAERLADHLSVAGVGAGQRVGVLVDRRPDLITTILAVLRLGAAYVALDPSYPQQRLEFVLHDANVSALVASPEVDFSSSVPVVRLSVLENSDAPRRTYDCETSDDFSDLPAYIIYTSGSTGAPKGCVVTNSQVVAMLRNTLPLFTFSSRDRWTLFHSASFDFSVWEMWGPLASGGTIILVPQTHTLDPELLVELLGSTGTTVLNHVPSVFRSFLTAYERCDHPALALRYLILGGEPIDLEVVKRFHRCVSGTPPTVVNMYGITEITVHATFKEISVDDLRDTVRSPIGEPLPHLQINVVDQHGDLCLNGDVGEMWISGPSVALGYHNRPSATADRFVNARGRRWYRSGDLARRLKNGQLSFEGRNDDQVKVRGFRIELGEVEASLRGVDGVIDAGAGVLADLYSGASVLIACFVAEGVSVADVRRQLRLTSPAHLVPSRFALVPRVPLTLSGKLDRAAISRLFD